LKPKTEKVPRVQSNISQNNQIVINFSTQIAYKDKEGCKQFVRDYLESIHWDKNPPAPALPADVVRKTREKYIMAFRQISGKELEL